MWIKEYKKKRKNRGNIKKKKTRKTKDKIGKNNKMRKIIKKRGKKGVSLLLSYVLLIGLAITLSGMVYAWMKLTVRQPFPEDVCHEGIGFYIEYGCDKNANSINITIRNNGKFNIDGYYIKIGNDSGIAKYSFNTVDFKELNLIDGLVPGNSSEIQFDYTEYGKITLLDIQIFEKIDGEMYPCPDAVFKRKIDDCI